jgi:transcriptional regulator with XRE-family HTH domain
MPSSVKAPSTKSRRPDKSRPSATFLQVLPRRIVKYRELRQVSQAALAKAARISRSTLNSIESGLASDMKISTLERLCHALGVSADAIMGYNSIRLVRSPKLHGLSPESQLGEGLGDARRCPTCGEQLRPRALHLPGDCMLELADNGESDRRIGIVFGLTALVVAVALKEEREIRRRRKI